MPFLMGSWTPLANRKDFLSGFFLVIFYVLGFYILQIFLLRIGVGMKLPVEAEICRWDGGFYKEIADGGYVFKNGPSNSGFFFLFPLLWHILHMGVWGATAMNVVLFATGLSLLASHYNLGTRDKLVWLTIPAFYIVFIPYSEALFFLLGTLCILGIELQRRPLIWISIFLLSLTRATTIFLVPACLAMQMMGSERRLLGKSLIGYFIDYLLPSILGLATFVIVQYAQTGVWFAYFIQQSTYWERKYTDPVFPLAGFEGSDRLIWLSALALFICLVAMLLLIRYFVLWLVKNKTANKAHVLSLAYLAITLPIIIFYNPKWGTHTTLVIGAIRYALVNPFFYVFLYYQTMKARYTWLHFLLVFIAGNLAWLAFGSFKDIFYTLFFAGNSVIIFFYMLYANKKLSWPAVVITALNFFFMVMLFQQFLNGQFPD